ncbi:40S ribosomal protein SA [Sciurus carolinensis]|uniref:40S ribosomal protein SA n=1 Tax=Sciurus carolinensis TaxID=30640 RepID=A0AA41N2B7_SCICA|nr:40S ribosomal protein SA [Sciurus carolinensis]
MSRALNILQMTEEEVLEFLAAGTQLGDTNLDFQMEQYTYKRKSDDICFINPKRTWKKLLLAASAIVAIEDPGDVSVISSRNTGQRAVLKFAAALEPLLLLVTSLLEPSLTKSRQPSRSHVFWWLLISGLTTSLLPVSSVTSILRQSAHHCSV